MFADLCPNSQGWASIKPEKPGDSGQVSCVGVMENHVSELLPAASQETGAREVGVLSHGIITPRNHVPWGIACGYSTFSFPLGHCLVGL